MPVVRMRLRLFGLAQARRYHDELFAVFDLIAGNPRMARKRRELSPPMRIHLFKAHLIVYRIDEDGDILFVGVRHGHEGWVRNATCAARRSPVWGVEISSATGSVFWHVAQCFRQGLPAATDRICDPSMNPYL